MNNDNLKISLLILLFSSFIFYQMKPSCMFHENGEFKSFGLKSNQTIIPFWLVISLIGVSSYYILIVKDGKFI